MARTKKRQTKQDAPIFNPPAPKPGVNESAPVQTELQYVARFGTMRRLGVMDADATFRYGDQVVAKTERGTEIATVLCEATPAAIDAMTETTEGRILRLLDKGDARQSRHLQSLVADDLTITQRWINKAKLEQEMELVEVERILGGERIVVYFLAESRVDFRELVGLLKKEFKTRIEMRQIGVRDEAKLLGDYGDCGQPLCCSRFLSKMPPVSMKMAKLQKSTLDPTRISGRCGRLKCCLRYEYDGYKESAKTLPTVESVVLTREGRLTVTAVDVLNRRVTVRDEEGGRRFIDADEILQVVKKSGK